MKWTALFCLTVSLAWCALGAAARWVAAERFAKDVVAGQVEALYASLGE